MTDKELTDFIEHGENGFVEFALTFGDGWAGQAIEIAKELRAALAQPEPEPVAWMWNINNGAGYSSRGIGFEQTNIPFAKHTPLYAVPPQRDFKFSTIEEAMQPMPTPTGQPQLTDDETRFANAFIALQKAGYGKEAEIVLKCKRKWVGLTGEELKEIYQCDGTVHFKFALIEQALKDKNK